MPYTEFHYTPTGTGVISGKEVLEQTEDAINDLGGQISGDVQTAIDTANNALNTANTASADAQNAVNTANTAYTAATNAQNTANTAQNTASNALTAAQNAQNDVNALGNRVTTAENNISQNTSDISGLTTRMGTAEGNITTLQNDVITAQGTATSAQNTATLARGQAYVVRYASVAVSDNSTVPYTDLNNIDNVKANDLLLDTNGKLYQISSVDTATETVSVTTPLTQLAVDSDVVHKSGNETVGGSKTFDSNTYVYNSDTNATTPNLYLRSSKIEVSSQGNTSGDQNLTYLDKNNVTYAYVKGAVQSNGSAVKIRAIAKDSSDNSVVNELQMLANTNGNKAIFPTYSNEVDLGVSNYKWKSFNGVEPSSLSLPSGNVSDFIDISSYLTYLDGKDNTYIAPANGWITIKASTATGISCTISNLWNDSRIRTNAGGLRMLFPILKGQTVYIAIYATTLDMARFIPCQGNV